MHANMICRVGRWRLNLVTISLMRHMHHDEPVSMVTPLGFHHPLVKPCMKFSLTRLSVNSPLTSFPFAHQHSQLQTSWAVYVGVSSPSQDNHPAPPFFVDPVQVTTLRSCRVLLSLLSTLQYDRVRLPSSSTPFRFLIGIVSCPPFADRGEGLPSCTDVCRNVSPLIPRREARLSSPYRSNRTC
jgi:hypothetical protein